MLNLLSYYSSCAYDLVAPNRHISRNLDQEWELRIVVRGCKLRLMMTVLLV